MMEVASGVIVGRRGGDKVRGFCTRLFAGDEGVNILPESQ